MTQIIACAKCGTDFPKTHHLRTLCDGCRPVHVNGDKELTCKECGKVFIHGVGRPPTTCVDCRGPWRSRKSSEWLAANKERPEIAARREARNAAYRARMNSNPNPCKIDSCTRPANSSAGMCTTHYSRAKRGSNMHAPVKPRLNINITPQGYVKRVFERGGRPVFEHRWVMEQILGRNLWPWENVHHKNGVKTDNSPSNLEVWIVSQPSGQRPEDLAVWVAETYPELLLQVARGEKPHVSRTERISTDA